VLAHVIIDFAMENPTRLFEEQANRRFEVLAPLGRGGFGSVYEARDLVSEQRVALKELGRANPDNLARFKQEFRALSGLHHPNLVGLKELFEQDGRWFILMELIEGRDLISYVRDELASDNDNARGYDEKRLRAALRGVAEGLTALHEFGVLHRDLKPSNVCVTPEGRAVLLDFGLVTSVDPARQSTHALGMGTAAYMAPEQALGRKIGPAADWYALGVCLFEALTERLPFDGVSGLEMLLRKQQAHAPSVSEFVRNAPADLEALCTALLERDPDARPSGRQVLTTLRGRDARASGEPRPSLAAPASPAFAGREVEIENLERALQRTYEGELRLVFVEGESGVGKSELAAEFLRSVKMRVVSLIGLAGRCYENEQVPYKAFDGCVDELARVLRHLPAEECARVLPQRAALLGQMFPVLNNVPAIARAKREELSADPTARRLEAFAAFAELLGKLAEDRPVVLVIDDLQWADAESFRLLKALVEQRVPPPLLIVATVRPRSELEPDVLEQIEKARAWKCTDVQLLYGLPRAQAEALASKLLGPHASLSWARAVAEESRGHPLLLAELVSFARSRELSESHAGALSLETALRARIESLDRASRELIEFVALAGRPYAGQIFARTLGLANIDELARPLLMAKLLRTRKGHELHCFHDRVRSAVVDLISRARLPHMHGRLAHALFGDARVDAAEYARHWDLAGEVERAVAAYQKAAEKALDALAFARAAELSGRALTLLGESRQERYRSLLVLRAHALARGGRSAEAAALYTQASDLVHGEQRIRLRTSAANQLMLNMQVMPGLLAAQRVLAEVGVRLPLTTARALARFAWERFCYAFFDRVVRRKSRDSARDRLALELISVFNRSLAVVHMPAYLALSVQHLRLAASLSDPEQLVQAFVVQGWLRTLRGSLAGAEALFEKSRALCSELGRPALSAWQALTEGNARMVAWKPAGAEACLTRAHELLRLHCPEQPRELTAVRASLGFTWFMLGRTDQAAAHVETWLAEARERQDHFAVAMLVTAGCAYLRHLKRDAPDEALAELDDVLSRVPAEPFSLVHFGYCSATQNVLLYKGGSAALRWLEAREAELSKRFVLKTRIGRESRRIWHMLALLRAAEHLSGSERRRCLKRARAVARKFDAGQPTFAAALAQQVLNQLDLLEGHTERARAGIARVLRNIEQTGAMGKSACLYLEGLLEPAPRGQEKCQAALEMLRDLGWQSPERALVLQLPLLSLLKRERAQAAAPKQLLLDRYHVLGPLGGGGFGNVSEARDMQTGRRVALKELVGRHARALERFKREFRALQDVHHESLVRLDALFEHRGSWFIAMELVEGSDLVSYVRPAGVCDLERLRVAFSGVAQALSALHEVGLVHRDVTPENVCVTRDGRAVLLDFGLIARAQDESELALVGTADYAAPEQLEGEAAQGAADVYALGVCLYRALSGRLPYAPATAPEVLRTKRERVPAPAELSGSPELALCLSMLDPDPSRRPSLAQVLTVLSPLTKQPAPTPRASVAPFDNGEFCGRTRELRLLQEALLSVKTHGLAVRIVRGESGLGKSALVDEFARTSCAAEGAKLLFSRCYENERIALKAFDGAVDQLARVLSRLPESECQELLPRRAALLAQLFPVLGGVPAISSFGRKGLPADPAARRLAAIECFLELLERLSARYLLVFVVDDLQWADGESFGLLRAMLERGSALRLLVVCTARQDSELEEGSVRQIAALCSSAHTGTIALEGLSTEEAARFAVHLLAREAPAEFVQQLAWESKGHPLFLRELIERMNAGTISSATSLMLDDALRARIAGLEPDARQLFALVALAGRPLAPELLARAAGRSELPRATVAQLLKQGLLSRRREGELACYHDRIREAALQVLSLEQRQKLASQLAEALETEDGAEPAERARLWDAAVRPERALAAYEQAGERALAGLKFEHAEQYYARALELLGERRDERYCHLSVQRAHALVRLGKSAEAASFFQQAAEVAQGELQMRLRVWAAQQLIQSAQVEAGLSAAQSVLRDLDLPFSRSDRGALARIAWERGRTALRGMKLAERTTPLTAAERLRLDALQELSSPVRAVSYLPGSLLVVQYLRRALDAGELGHGARALAYDAFLRTLAAPAGSRASWFDRSRELAQQSGEPALLAEVELMCGYACFARGDARTAAVHLSGAHELLQTRCAGQPWLLTATRMYLGCSWIASGDLRLLASSGAAWLAEAEAKQDRYACAALAGFGGVTRRHLMRDDQDAALAELDSVLAPWLEQPFSTIQFGALLVRIDALVQRGGRAALDWLDAHEGQLARAVLLRSPSLGWYVATRRVTACLSAIDDPARAAEHPLFAAALEVARSFRRFRRNAPGRLHLLLAVLSALQGRRELAIEHARSAQAFVSEMVSVRGALYVEGWLLGGSEGSAKCQAVLDWLTNEGCVNPERYLRELVPGLHLMQGR
jgi:eukaryotic-like serine/threonine-protein kinase